MAKGIFVSGTGTGVGKSAISAGLTLLLRQNGFNATYCKPVASGALTENGASFSGDLRFVKRLAQLDDADKVMNPYLFDEPLSPHLAAHSANTRIEKETILRSVDALKSAHDAVVVEGAGGLMVPLSSNYMQYDLINDLKLPCVFVAQCTLGTINHSLLSIRAARSLGIDVRGIIFNGYAGGMMQDDAIASILRLGAVELLYTVPHFPLLDVDANRDGGLAEYFAAQSVSAILGAMNEF